MTDFARLGIAVDTRQVIRASDDLGGFVRAGRAASGATEQLERSTGQARAEFGRFGKSAGGATAAASALGKAIGAVAVGLAGFASAQQAAVQARGFQAAMAETSTLIEGTRAEMSLVEQEARRMAATFGGNATQQVKAFYQAISAGADSVEAAAQILDQSNRLAIGGVTDITTGVDALTTAVNAYSATGLTAAEASDAMFVGMKAGKTTIGELSAQMGQIVPIASAAGVSFDEMIAGISALTTQGQSTAMATTGLRAAITGILQPSKQAADAARAMGLEFSASALQAKGLEQFMADVVKATGGNTDAMTQLFGSVEALNAVLAFSGAAGQTFTDIMAEMGDKAGATDEAFAKVADGVDQRLNAAFGKFTNLATQVGHVILTAGVPAVEALAAGAGILSDNFNSVIGVVTAAGVAVATAYAPAVYGAVTATGAWIASLITLRGALIASGVGVLVVGAGLLVGKLLDLVQATGGWGLALRLLGSVASGVWEGITTAAKAIQPALDAVWSNVAAGFLRMVRSIAKTWAEFLHGVTAGAKAMDFLPGMDSTILALGNAAISAGSGVHGLTASINEYQQSADAALQQSRDLVDLGFEKASAALATLNLVIAKHGEGSGEAVKATNALNDALKKLEKGGKKAGKGLKKTKTEAEAFGDALEDAAYTAEDLGKAKADILVGGIDGVSSAWSDFVARGFSDFKGFARNVLDSFTGMLTQMVALAARNQIMIGLGIGGVSGAAAGAGGLGAGGGGFLGLAGNAASLLGGGTALAGITGGAAASLGLGGYASAGLFNIGANAALASAATGSSALMATIGAAMAPVAIIAASVAVLVKGFSRKYKGGGLEGSFTPDGLEDGLNFDFWKGGFLRSDKWVRKPLEEEFELTLNLAMKGLAGGVVGMADTLGLGTKALKDFEKVGWSVWTHDKTPEQVQQFLQEEMQKSADQMAELILGGDEYLRMGESHLEAMTRMSAGLLAVNDAMDLLGRAAFETSIAAGDAASSLIDAFGGQEAMAAATTAYWTGFYSEAERRETVMRRLGDQFEALGIAMPESRDGFRQMIESIDLTAASGRALYAELLGLSASLDQVLPKVSAYTEAMQGIVDQIGGEIGLQIGAARDMARLTEQSAQLWYRTATTLRDFLSDLLNTDLTAASRSQSIAVNRSRFETAFDMARGGDVDAARDVPALAKAYLESARNSASTSLEYRRIAAQVQGQVSFLAGIAELEGANDDVLRGLYEQQIEVLTGLGMFLQLEGLTADQVAELGDGVQALTENWDGTVLAFEGSLGALEDAIRNAEAFSYDDLVGRLDVAVSLADDAPRWVQRLVDSADAGLRTTLDFVIRNDELSPADKWIATNAASEHVSALDFVLRNDLDRATRRLVLKTTGELHRDLNLTLAKDLDADTRQMLLTRNQGLTRRVNVALTKDGDKAIRSLNRLQDLIGTKGSGKITFDGGLALTADEAFKGLSDGVQDLVSPINKLRGMLGELRDAVDADRVQRENTLKIAGLQVKGADAVVRTQQAQGVVDEFNALRSQYGIGLVGQKGTVSVNDAGRIQTSFDYYSGGDVVGFKKALRSEFGTDAIGSVFNATNRRVGSAEDRAEALRQQVKDLGGIPKFARGTNFAPGGRALVGEEGPEIVDLPRGSTVHPYSQSRAMLDNGDVVRELRELRKEVSELRKDKHRADFQKIRETKEIKRLAQKQDVVGVKIQEEQA
ncbi:phage tail tape measure protein [Leisingera methylohalidivorans]|uniref:Phage tail tape measure protein domain-containing protein n=1 Tax=Leisingera methylohalidivorans DSM 14336 TaxID=999552 RepID=V9VYD2_9RHOB|nr:phage tail tape measure protein [Leisingera methylohalidivorans]AHD02953.1 hypothetical protein METH_06900 [Leisingera methylohalidivorans DSM 14336]